MSYDALRVEHEVFMHVMVVDKIYGPISHFKSTPNDDLLFDT